MLLPLQARAATGCRRDNSHNNVNIPIILLPGPSSLARRLLPSHQPGQPMQPGVPACPPTRSLQRRLRYLPSLTARPFDEHSLHALPALFGRSPGLILPSLSGPAVSPLDCGLPTHHGHPSPPSHHRDPSAACLRLSRGVEQVLAGTLTESEGTWSPWACY